MLAALGCGPGTTAPPTAYGCMSHLIKPVVLIVEDEQLVRMVVAEAFVDEGFVVLEAEDAADALLIYALGGHIQVLFTDINMPGKLNGIDLAEHLRAVAPDLQIIITSALPVLRAIDHLPATFIAKPYNAAAVSRSARGLLAA